MGADCDQASLEALPVYNDASECVAETHPSDVVATDTCLAKMRNALELIERAEAVCSGEVLSEIRLARDGILDQIPKLEKSQAYYRGEVDATEVLKELLKDE